MDFFFSKINDYVTGSISMKNKGMAVHYFELDTDFNKKKYLFININSHNVLKNLWGDFYLDTKTKRIKQGAMVVYCNKNIVLICAQLTKLLSLKIFSFLDFT